VDQFLPTVRPRFQRVKVVIGDEPHILYYRNVVDCIKALFGAAEFAQYLVFVPEKHYTDETKNTRLYHGMHTGKWWEWTQAKFDEEKPGATLIPIILSSDKTQITLFGGKSAYPVYLTIGNLPKEIRRKPSMNAQILLAYLPVADFEAVTNQAARRRMKANLFHACMRKILQPLVEAGKQGVPMASGDGVIRRCHPILAAYACDYMEQILVVGCKMGECSECQVPPHELGIGVDKYKTRNLGTIRAALATYHTAPNRFTSACRDAGIKPIVHPFWEDLPHCNIFRCITPDILHQLYQGLIKHLVTWLKSAYSKSELDARCRKLPPNHQVRHFLKGITHLNRLTGKEHSDIARILLGLIIDIPLPDGRSPVRLVKAVRAMLDFLYLAQYPVHSTETLKHLEQALKQFHDNKIIFEELDIRDSWEIPKLHFAIHYLTLIKWLGTTDNFDTQYTERLHIDFAKDAYEATNHKDEFAQMTLWLERKEKIIKHASFIEWRLAGSPSHELTLATLSKYPSRITMTKHPSRKAVPFSEIIEEYGAKYIEDALVRYITHIHNPTLSWAQVEARSINKPLFFNRLAVYHRMKLWLGDKDHHRLMADETDVIHARPARKDKYSNIVPGRFDIALIDDGHGNYTSVQGTILYLGVQSCNSKHAPGYRLGQVRLIFSFSPKISKGAFAENNQPPKYLAYVEWFKPFERAPRPHHLLYRVKRSLDEHGRRLSSIIPLDSIRRSIHLIPHFGSQAPAAWTSDNVLDLCETFYVNSFSDRHSYHTIV
jgi:hypothetical protein